MKKEIKARAGEVGVSSKIAKVSIFLIFVAAIGAWSWSLLSDGDVVGLIAPLGVVLAITWIWKPWVRQRDV